MTVNKEYVRLIFTLRWVNIPIYIFQNRNSVLHKAAGRGELEIVKLLLESSNININQKNKVWVNVYSISNDKHDLSLTSLDMLDKNVLSLTNLHWISNVKIIWLSFR